MKAVTVIYAVVTVAVFAMAGALPFLAHTGGAKSVPGWQAFVDPGSLSSKHQFLSTDCEACHTPHRGPAADKCIGCHANNAALLGKQSTAFHASIGDCRGCHAEHLGVQHCPTRMSHEALPDAALRGAGGLSAEAADNLRRALLSAVGGPGRSPPHSRISRAEIALNCSACHGNEDPHRTLFGFDCAACHATGTWSIPEFRHPAPTSTDCAQCHQAPPSHYMEHFHMVSMKVARVEHARVDQCFICHKTNSWNDIKGVGWYKHH